MKRTRRSLVCRQLVEKVSAYLDGDLSPRDRNAVEEHLAGCGACAGYVAQVRRMLELTAGPEQVLLDPTIVDDLVSRFNG